MVGCTLGGASGEPMAVARPEPSGPLLRHAGPGRRLDVCAAEDDDHAIHGPQPEPDEHHDGHHDASAVRLHDPQFPQRPGHLLGGFQYHRHRDTVFRHRLGGSQDPDQDSDALDEELPNPHHPCRGRSRAHRYRGRREGTRWNDWR